MENSWRKNLDSVPRRLEAVMETNIPDISHDVTFLVGLHEVRVSCHKIFLSVASPVFQTIFKQLPSLINDMSTPGVNSAYEIIIPDVHPDGFKSLIKYAYTGILNVDPNHLMVTMYAAHKYDISELTKYCSQELCSTLNLENVVTIYQAAQLLNEANLKTTAWSFIEAKAAVLLDSEQFLQLSDENLRKFLSLERIFGLKSEVIVFKALLSWGRLKCERKDLKKTTKNLKSVVKPYLSLIRFPTMEGDEFNEVVVKSFILNSSEVILVLEYLASSKQKQAKIGANFPYPCARRANGDDLKFLFSYAAKTEKLKIQPYKNYHINDEFIIIGDGNATTINLKSVGVVLPAKYTDSSPKSVSIGLHDFSTGEWVHTAKATVFKSMEICYIEFIPPESLKINVKYQLHVNIYNGQWVEESERVDLVSFSKELMSESTFIWSNVDKQQLKLEFIPKAYIVWALQFEN